MNRRKRRRRRDAAQRRRYEQKLTDAMTNAEYTAYVIAAIKRDEERQLALKEALAVLGIKDTV